MASFSYKAVRNDGKLIKGILEALNIHDLESRLERSGCELIDARERKSRRSAIMHKKITRRDLIDFFIHLEQMVMAGIPVIESLNDFRVGLAPSPFKDLVSSLVGRIESGSSLSAAMQAEDKVFSGLMIELVKVGEVSGELGSLFGEIKDTLKWQDEMVSQTKKMMMYPLFVGVVVFAVLCFMMIYLVPQMVDFITSLEGEIPIHTLALIAVSDFFVNAWYIVLFLPLVLFVALKIAIARNATVRFHFDKLILGLPVVGPVIKKIILARFATNFSLLYRSGIGVLQGLGITKGVVNNRYVEQEINYIQNQVTEGSSISDAFARMGLFPQLVLRMIRVGEQTGGLDKSLLNASYFYNRDVKDSVEKIQQMIEPTMTVILGLLLGWIMISVLGPIYDLISGLDI